MSLESMVGVEYGWLVGVCRCSGWGLDYVTVSVFGWCVSFLTSVEKYVDFIKVLICSHLVFLLFIVIPSYIFRQMFVQCGQLGSTRPNFASVARFALGFKSPRIMNLGLHKSAHFGLMEGTPNGHHVFD